MNVFRTDFEKTDVSLRGLAGFWLDVIFPPTCAHCGRIGWLLCPVCQTEMIRVPDAVCPQCGRMDDQPISAGTGVLCRQCRAHPPLLGQMRAPLRYEEPTSTLIHRFKYEGYFALGRPLARFLIDGWPAWDIPPDLILPIPLHPQRRRQRGYNQAELLARSLAEAINVPVNVSTLRRTRHTVPQVGLGPGERHNNVWGAFAAEGSVVRDRHILLIDDVLTTGATLSAAAETLLAAGAASVSGYCLARVS